MNTPATNQVSTGKEHLKSTLENKVIFNPEAVEIAILDRWGRPVWKEKREKSVEPLSWNGIDLFGCMASAGSYLCKIVYPDKMVVYVPFVFLQK
jgi:hypothetical protein